MSYDNPHMNPAYWLTRAKEMMALSDEALQLGQSIHQAQEQLQEARMRGNHALAVDLAKMLVELVTKEGQITENLKIIYEEFNSVNAEDLVSDEDL